MKINYFYPEDCKRTSCRIGLSIVTIYRTGLVVVARQALERIAAKEDSKFIIASEEDFPENLYITLDEKGFQARPLKTGARAFNNSNLTKRLFALLKVPGDVKHLRMHVAAEPIQVQDSKVLHWSLIKMKKRANL